MVGRERYVLERDELLNYIRGSIKYFILKQKNPSLDEQVLEVLIGKKNLTEKEREDAKEILDKVVIEELGFEEPI